MNVIRNNVKRKLMLAICIMFLTLYCNFWELTSNYIKNELYILILCSKFQRLKKARKKILQWNFYNFYVGLRKCIIVIQTEKVHKFNKYQILIPLIDALIVFLNLIYYTALLHNFLSKIWRFVSCFDYIKK